MSMKLETEGVMMNVFLHVGCEKIWSELDEVVDSIPRGERVVIGADFNGHVIEGNRGDKKVMGRYGVKERNVESPGRRKGPVAIG